MEEQISEHQWMDDRLDSGDNLGGQPALLFGGPLSFRSDVFELMSCRRVETSFSQLCVQQHVVV